MFEREIVGIRRGLVELDLPFRTARIPHCRRSINFPLAECPANLAARGESRIRAVNLGAPAYTDKGSPSLRLPTPRKLMADQES